jgi:hypothetical protein
LVRWTRILGRDETPTDLLTRILAFIHVWSLRTDKTRGLVKRLPVPSPVFESYWRFASERQAIYERRLLGHSPPWTDDSIISAYRFTNTYRAADRVSQYLIREVIYGGDSSPDQVVFRIFLFRFFNKIETWKLLQDTFGIPTLGDFDPERAGDLFEAARAEGRSVYSNAYIIPPVPGQPAPKHAGHLRLAVELAEGGLPFRIGTTSNLEDLFLLIREVPGLGDFLAYQLAIDLCYSEVVSHDEDEFVVAGPGAVDGLSKVFPDMDLRQAAAVIRRLAEEQEEWFEYFHLPFAGLFGRRLHLIDIQNLFCEISKYARIAHPEYVGVAGRTRIKQTFKPAAVLPTPFFPPKWKTVPTDADNVGANSLIR